MIKDHKGARTGRRSSKHACTVCESDIVDAGKNGRTGQRRRVVHNGESFAAFVLSVVILSFPTERTPPPDSRSSPYTAGLMIGQDLSWHFVRRTRYLSLCPQPLPPRSPRNKYLPSFALRSRAVFVFRNSKDVLLYPALDRSGPSSPLPVVSGSVCVGTS